MNLWLCIGVRIVANPLSNVFQKLLTRQGASALAVVCVTHALLSLACAPLAALAPPPLNRQFWSNMVIGALLNVAGNALLVQAMKLSDLSVLGPINAYKPVASLLPALLLLGEVPAMGALLGVALVVGGSYALVDRGDARGGNPVVEPATGAGTTAGHGAYGHRRRQFGWAGLWSDRGVQCRFAALIFAALEAVFLKRALLVSSPLPTFVVWSLLGLVVALPVALRQLRKPAALVTRAGLRSFAALAVTTGLMQFCTIVVLGGLQVGYALALFQISAVISVVLGRQFFGEGHFRKRLLGSAIMAAGAVLIVVCR